MGIDLDWEDPGTTAAIDKGQGLDPAGNPKYGGRTFTKAQAALDKPNFCTLLTEYRTAINAKAQGVGTDFLLSIAASANPSIVPSGYDFQCMNKKVLDWVGIMYVVRHHLIGTAACRSPSTSDYSFFIYFWSRVGGIHGMAGD